MALEPPIPAAADYTVTEDDLATALASGDVEVLATPVSYTHLTLTKKRIV